MNDKIYPSMVIKSQAEAIELLEKENQQLKRNCNIGNENLKFYKKENTQLKSVIKEIREYIQKNKLYTYKYDEEELFEITTDEAAKTDLLQILDKGDKE